MRLTELLNPSAVTLKLKAREKRAAIDELVQLLESAHGLNSQGEVLDRVLRREAMMSTGIGYGVAIPHGKARAADSMVAACAVSPEGVDFASEDGQPVYLLVLFVSPENATTQGSFTPFRSAQVSTAGCNRSRGSAAARYAAHVCQLIRERTAIERRGASQPADSVKTQILFAKIWHKCFGDLNPPIRFQIVLQQRSQDTGHRQGRTVQRVDEFRFSGFL